MTSHSSSVVLSPQQRARLDRWVALDPDPATAGELQRLADDDPAATLALFDGRIGFGTAGLRAEMGPGPMRMNRLVVRQTTAGLLRYLPPEPTVVIGYDARHNSEVFARDTAAVVAGAGGRAELLPKQLPTPVLARAVLDRDADAGIMITASHNPAADNGYKLYLADGIQLVAPADATIAAAIDEVAAAMADPSITAADAHAVIPLDPDAVIELDDEAAARHLEVAVEACVGTNRSVNVLYTAMHGVGGEHLLAAFAAAGFPAPEVVPEQFAPDPDFPTARFPNPEEQGALDLAFAAAEAATGESRTIDVILANDPDADRLAVAVLDRHGRWTRLTGDQVGVLLADHLLKKTTGSDRLVASSLVSSRLISAIAAAGGVAEERTLTGFKWVARPIVDQPHKRFVLGYEEALGYCVGDRVRDKDGISAALVMAELVAEAVAVGESLFDRLDRLAVEHGVHLTRPVTLLFTGSDGPNVRTEAMNRARTNPPDRLAGVVVERVDDLAVGGPLPPTDGVVWHLADRSRVVIRPSGTEPKLKAYLEVIEPVDEGALKPATQRATDRLDALATAVETLLKDSVGAA